MDLTFSWDRRTDVYGPHLEGSDTRLFLPLLFNTEFIITENDTNGTESSKGTICEEVKDILESS